MFKKTYTEKSPPAPAPATQSSSLGVNRGCQVLTVLILPCPSRMKMLSFFANAGFWVVFFLINYL